MSNNYVELAFDRVVNSTKAAILFDMGEKEPVWVPISQIDMDEYASDEDTVFITEWFAMKEGLI